MELKLVGAGLRRTGTMSSKLAAERLYGAPCYHNLETIQNPEHIHIWHSCLSVAHPDFDRVLAGYIGTLDYPAVGFWRELAAANPNVPVLLSSRSDPDTWWLSASRTVFRGGPTRPPGANPDPRVQLSIDIFKARFCPDYLDEEQAKAAYERHNAEVRAEVPADRLIDWQPGDGWEPLCARLGLAVPGELFPHVNSTEELLSQRAAAEAAQPTSFGD
jgi:hypothetical protein